MDGHMKINFNLLNENDYKQIFMAFFFLKLIIQSALDRRQMAHLIKYRVEIPGPFKESISLETHRFSTDYALSKLRAGHLFRFFNTAILLFWTYGGGIGHLYQWVLTIIPPFFGPLSTAVFYFIVLGFSSSLMSLPQELMETFIIEEKFKKNKTTLKLFIADHLKGAAIGFIIGIPLLFALFYFIFTFPKSWWFLAFLLIMSFQIIMLWAYPTVIAPLFNKFTPIEENETKDRILALLKKTGFESKGLFVMDASKRSTHGNAYFSGIGRAKRIVFFDTLLKQLSPLQMEAVLAHELGHFKKKHVLKMIAVTSIFLFIQFYIISIILNNSQFLLGHGVKVFSVETGLALILTVIPIYTFLLTPMLSLWSRKHEYEADDYASKQASAKELENALLILHTENSQVLYPEPLFSSFYYSHPGAIERITSLRKSQMDL